MVCMGNDVIKVLYLEIDKNVYIVDLHGYAMESPYMIVKSECVIIFKFLAIAPECHCVSDMSEVVPHAHSLLLSSMLLGWWLVVIPGSNYWYRWGYQGVKAACPDAPLLEHFLPQRSSQIF